MCKALIASPCADNLFPQSPNIFHHSDPQQRQALEPDWVVSLVIFVIWINKKTKWMWMTMLDWQKIVSAKLAGMCVKRCF